MTISYFDDNTNQNVYKEIKYAQSNFGIYPYSHQIYALLTLPYSLEESQQSSYLNKDGCSSINSTELMNKKNRMQVIQNDKNKFALIVERGNCTFFRKALNAEEA